VRTKAAHRAQRAKKLIRVAYADDPTFDPAKANRYELLGESTALVRLSHPDADCWVDVRLAQEQSTGRVIRLLRENRAAFRSVREMLSYFERLYATYGGPNGEPPLAPASEPSRTSRHLKLLR